MSRLWPFALAGLFVGIAAYSYYKGQPFNAGVFAVVGVLIWVGLSKLRKDRPPRPPGP